MQLGESEISVIYSFARWRQNYCSA